MNFENEADSMKQVVQLLKTNINITLATMEILYLNLYPDKTLKEFQELANEIMNTEWRRTEPEENNEKDY